MDATYKQTGARPRKALMLPLMAAAAFFFGHQVARQVSNAGPGGFSLLSIWPMLGETARLRRAQRALRREAQHLLRVSHMPTTPSVQANQCRQRAWDMWERAGAIGLMIGRQHVPTWHADRVRIGDAEHRRRRAAMAERSRRRNRAAA